MVRSEQGDTLLEILIAILVIALTVTALLGALVETITSSTQHRTLSTLDNLLNSFSQSVENEVQGKAQQQPLFLNCPRPATPGVVSPYQVLSAPIPAVGPAGTQMTVFLSGWAPGAVAATVGGVTAPSYVGPTTVPANGDLALSFTVPSLSANGPQPVVITDGSTSAQTPTSFVFQKGAAGGTPSLSGYSMGIASVEQWDPRAQPPAFDTAQPCVTSGMQRVTATAQLGSASATLSFVVLGAAQTTVTIAYQVPPSPASPSLEDTLAFQATVIPPNDATPPPTGTMTWDFSGSPGSPTCAGSANNVTALGSGGGNSGTATCTIANALAGHYVITASYSGDGNYHSARSATLQKTVAQANLTATITPSPSNPVPGQTLTFSATIKPPAGDPIPTLTDTVTWTFAASPGSPQCAGTSGSNITTVTQGNGNTATATCAVNNVSAGTYSVSAVFSGDTNYFSATAPTDQATVAKATPTLSVKSAFNNSGSRLTFTATVTPPAGDPVPTGPVSWAFTAGPGNPTCLPSNLAGDPATATCVVAPTQLGVYTVTAAYGGNASYVPAMSPPASASVPAGSDIQGLPGPAGGKPDSGDKIVYTYNQAMDPTSFANQWNGTGSLAVFASFSRQGSVTSLTVCTSRFNCNNTAVNLGTVTLGDTGPSHYTGAAGSIVLTATLSLATNGGGQTVATLTLGSVAQGGNLTAVAGPTTLTWTPSNRATTTADTACSANAVSESSAPKANF
jgi:large repetitive protein